MPVTVWPFVPGTESEEVLHRFFNQYISSLGITLVFHSKRKKKVKKGADVLGRLRERAPNVHKCGFGQAPQARKAGFSVAKGSQEVWVGGGALLAPGCGGVVCRTSGTWGHGGRGHGGTGSAGHLQPGKHGCAHIYKEGVSPYSSVGPFENKLVI